MGWGKNNCAPLQSKVVSNLFWPLLIWPVWDFMSINFSLGDILHIFYFRAQFARQCKDASDVFDKLEDFPDTNG
jgi:hypothetical protein